MRREDYVIKYDNKTWLGGLASLVYRDDDTLHSIEFEGDARQRVSLAIDPHYTRDHKCYFAVGHDYCRVYATFDDEEKKGIITYTQGDSAHFTLH